MNIDGRLSNNRLEEFSNELESLSHQIGFKVSSRGWAYLLENRRVINKDQFDKVTNLINRCRRVGLLPIDFVAEEDARAFKGVEFPEDHSVIYDFGLWLKSAKNVAENYTPDWWVGEEYYIQMVVEKIDLVTLFKPVCEKYHIPIANSKGWSSMLQRAEYAKRFRDAEADGKLCVLLYCGDHDPDGVRISEFIRKNLADLQDVRWEFGSMGYDPCNLIIERFGLNADFIEAHDLTWIDNLITGSGSNLGSPSHKNHYMPYVQDYINEFGIRKCEANAIITMPKVARDLVNDSIIKFLGDDAPDRFEKKRQAVRDEFEKFMNDTGLDATIDEVLEVIKEYDE